MSQDVWIYPPYWGSQGTGGTSPFLLWQADPTVTNGRVLTAGTNISLTIAAGVLTINAAGGGFTTGTYITQSDETGNLPNSFRLVGGAGISVNYTTNVATISASGAGLGTVTQVTAHSLNPIFNTNVTNGTSTPDIIYALASANPGLFLASPSANFGSLDLRPLVYSDIPIIAGTGTTLTRVGNSLQISASGYQPLSSTLNALASSLNGTGYIVQTGPNTFAERVFTGSSGYILLTNPDGVAGATNINVGSNVFTNNTSPTLNGLASGLGGQTGFVVQTGDSTFVDRSITGTAGRVNVTNGAGQAGNTSIDVGPQVFTEVNTSTIFNILSSGSASQDRTALGVPAAADAFVTVGVPPAELTNGRQVIGGIGVQLIDNGAGSTLAIEASGALGGTVTSVTPPSSIITATAGPAIVESLVTQPGTSFWAAPINGDGPPSFRYIIGTDLQHAIQSGTTNLTISYVGSSAILSVSAGSGTVASVGLVLPTGIFSVSNSPVTSTGNLTGTLISQHASSFLASPIGADGTPFFRTIIGTDLQNALTAGSNITLSYVGSSVIISATSSGGATSVTSVSNSDGTLHITPTTGDVVASIATSVNLPGTPTTQTPSPGDNTSKIATTAFVVNLASGYFNYQTSGILNALSSGLSGQTGFIVQLSDNSVIDRTITGTTNRIVVTNGSGVVGAPSIDVGSNVFTNNTSPTLNGLASGLGGQTGIVVQTGDSTFVDRQITGTAGNIVITNPAGQAGNINVNVGPQVYTETTSTSIFNTLSSGTAGQDRTALGTPAASDAFLVLGAVPAELTAGRQAVAGPGVQFVDNGVGSTLAIEASGALGGTVTSVNVVPPSSIITATGGPITVSGSITESLVSQPASTFWRGPISGAAAGPWFGPIIGTDLNLALQAGSNITLTYSGSSVTIASSGTSYTAGPGIQISGTTISSYASAALLSIGNLSTWFNTTNSNGAVSFNPTGVKGDIPYYSNTNTAANLAIGLNSQVQGVTAGLPAYVNLLQGFASAVANATLTNASNSYQAIDASQTTVTLILPAASAAIADIFYFKNITVTGTNACTITTNGTDVFDGGGLSKTLLKLQVIAVISDGVSTWRYLKPQIESPQSGGTGAGPTSITNGQIPIGSTSSGVAVWGNITPGTNITITNSSNGITINSTASGGGGSSITWSNLTGLASAASNHKYTIDVSGGSFPVYMPATGTMGDIIGFKVKSVGSPANTLTITPYQTIDQISTPITSSRLNEYFQFEYDGSLWWETS